LEARTSTDARASSFVPSHKRQKRRLPPFHPRRFAAAPEGAHPLGPPGRGMSRPGGPPNKEDLPSSRHERVQGVFLCGRPCTLIIRFTALQW
jgi:hypothetical protein